jgi:hypothetical protein
MSQLIFLDSGIVGIVTNPKTDRVSSALGPVVCGYVGEAPFVGMWEKRDRALCENVGKGRFGGYLGEARSRVCGM